MSFGVEDDGRPEPRPRLGAQRLPHSVQVVKLLLEWGLTLLALLSILASLALELIRPREGAEHLSDGVHGVSPLPSLFFDRVHYPVAVDAQDFRLIRYTPSEYMIILKRQTFRAPFARHLRATPFFCLADAAHKA